MEADQDLKANKQFVKDNVTYWLYLILHNIKANFGYSTLFLHEFTIRE